MKKFEYMYKYSVNGPLEPSDLDEYGEEGWELAGILKRKVKVDYSDVAREKIYYYFKRLKSITRSA